MITNLANVRNAHRTLVQETKRAVDAELQRAGKFGADHVEKHHRFKNRTGRLAKSTKHRVRAMNGGGKLILTWPRVKYAAAIDSGARAHVIRPVRKTFLRFKPKGSASWVFARKVNHPGNKPYKFGWRAIHAAHRRVGARMQQRMQALAKRF